MKDKSKNRILNGPIWNAMIWFAIPIALSSLLQQLFNAADQAVVGQFAGKEALAAVGANTPVVALFVNVFSSCSVGANALIARRIGEDQTKEVNRIVHTAITFAFSAGIVLMALGLFVAPAFLAMLGTPTEVLRQAALYFRIYAIAFPFVLIFNFGAAILRSIGDTRRPMIALIIAGIVNVILNLILVMVFHMGVAGVAIATTISNMISCTAVVFFLYKEEGFLQLRFSRLGIEKQMLSQIVQIGGPASLQSAVFSIANICIQSGINSLGAATVAGSAIISNMETIAYQIVNSFNQAATTFCGQNYGASQMDRCRKVVRIALLEAICGAAIYDFLMLLLRYQVIGIFTTDPQVLKAALIKLSELIALQYMVSFYEIPSACLRSMGKSLMPALLTIVGCVAFRVIWLVTVFRMYPTFKALILVYPASWVVTASLIWIYYFTVRNQLYGVKGDVSY